MDAEIFKIHLNNLILGKKEAIDACIDATLLEVEEAEIHFQGPIHVMGGVELVEGTLVLTVSIDATAEMPCAVCNAPTSVPLHIGRLCHTEAASPLRNGVFLYKDSVREALLLALPMITECHQGNCPNREVLNKYRSQ